MIIEKKNQLFYSPGDDIKIIAKFHVPGKVEYMQFSNMDMVWKNAFKESNLIPLELKSTDFIIDPELTEGKKQIINSLKGINDCLYLHFEI